MPYLQTLPDGSLLLNLYVQPKASRNEIVGIHNGALKLRLTSPPIDGKANKALIAYFAKTLKLAKASIIIASGHQGRTKKIQILDLDETTARRLLNEAVGGSLQE